MLPTLQFFSDGQEHFGHEIVEAMAAEFKITPEERERLLPSGRQRRFDNRVAWARFHLRKALLLEQTRRGYNQITARGRDVLKKKPDRIDMRFLMQFPEFKEFRSKRRDLENDEADAREEQQALTLEETLETAHAQIRERLADELLDTLKTCTPAFFEKVVIEVLVAMGYGGSLQDAGRAVGRSGDGGIDGIIKEDRLGLDVIYLQAKRWENVVGRPEIQKFVGALTGQRARKGVFITTSGFSKDALDYVSRIDMKIVLVDGETLAQMMIEHNVGVATMARYELKRIDSDYFSEE